ncbi:MAG: hypothetical protein IMW98_08965 [Firmicutes bacterium]|nr:hypothetical protein [Bacillota bacterium]
MRVDEEVARHFRLEEPVRRLLLQNVATMDRRERRLYKRELEPRADAMREFIAALFDRERMLRGPAVEDEWATWIATDVRQRGYTSVLAGWVMDVIGRGKVARILDALK